MNLVAPPSWRVLWLLWAGWALYLAAPHLRPQSPTLYLDAWLHPDRPSVIQVFADDGDGYRPQLSAQSPLEAAPPSQPQRLALELPHGAHKLRLDPVAQAGPFRLERVELEYAGRRLEFVGEDLRQWRPLRGLRETAVGPGGLEFSAEDEDPMLELELPSAWHAAPIPAWRTALAGWLGWVAPPPGLSAGLLVLAGLWLALARRPEAWRADGASWRVHAVALALPVLLVWLLYYPALGNWFMFDDPCHLLYLQQNGILPGFYDPARSGSYANFTPLFFASVGLDFHLFGMEPRYYYLHHLLSASLALGLVYAACARFLPPLAAALVAALLVVSVPVAESAHSLMVRHYLEGLGWAALALWLFVHALRRRDLRWAGLGALVYLAAALSKEIYVPLAGLVLFQPLDTWRERLRLAWPYLLAGLVYTAWRLYVLGGLTPAVSGYALSGAVRSPGLQDLLEFPGQALAMLRLPAWHLGLLGVGLALWLGWVSRRPRRHGLAALVWVGALLLPVVPVMTILSPRYLLLPVLMLYLAAVLGYYHTLRVLRPHPALVLLLGLALLAGALPAGQAHLTQMIDLERASNRAKGQFLFETGEAGAILLDPVPHCLYAYPLLRPPERRADAPLAVVSSCDALALAGQTARQRPYFRYQNGRLVPQAADFSACQLTTPLHARFDYNAAKRSLAWRFGPYPAGSGQYYFSSSPGGNLHFVPLAAQGRARLPDSVNLDQPLQLWIKYVAPDHKETPAQRLVLDLRPAGKVGTLSIDWRQTEETAP